jgi:hypothetical protein
MQLELTKIVVRAVVAERENGRTVGERITEEVAFYTEEQLAAFLPKLLEEIKAENAAKDFILGESFDPDIGARLG